jgi:hypothetical protein
VTGSNHTATAEPGEPAHHTSSATRSVWWSWTAPSSGAVQIILVPYSSMRVAVYTGDSLATLQPLTSSLSTASFNAVQGTTYQIAVDTAWWDTDGYEAFTWYLGFLQSTPAPSNTNEGLIVHRPLLPSFPAVIQWNAPAIFPAGSLTHSLRIIETSTNLVDWIPYTSAPAQPAELHIVPSLDESHRFFRVR